MSEPTIRDQVAALLEDLNLKLAKTLLEKVKSPECDAATLNAARAFLKDNDMTSRPSANPHLKPLGDTLGDVENIDEAPIFKIR